MWHQGRERGNRDGTKHEDRDEPTTGIERMVERRECPGSYEDVLEVGRKTRETGVTPPSNQQPQ